MNPGKELDRLIVRHRAVTEYYKRKQAAILLKNGFKPPQEQTRNRRYGEER